MKDKGNIAIAIVMIVCVGIILYILGKDNTSVVQMPKQEVRVENVEEEQTMTTKDKPDKAAQDSTMNANDILQEINVGWNLGNTLDSCVDVSLRNTDGSKTTEFYETAWGNPVATQQMIDTVANAGFRAIRIPVTWYYNTYEENGTLKIQEKWLARVKEVVDYAYERDMYVIINSHHDGEVIYADKKNYKKVAKNVEALWSQIATYFKGYDEHLIFGGINELNDKSNSWETTEKNVEINNKLNQVYVDAVRNAGGKNKTRLLICGTYLNVANEGTLDGFVLPEDETENMLAAEVHMYSNIYNQELEETLEYIESFGKRIQAPVVIGEFGVTSDYEPIQLRSQYAANFVYRASEHGMVCFWWDDGSQYKLLDRANLQWTDEAVLSGLMNPQPYETVYTAEGEYGKAEEYRYTTIHGATGVEEESDWGVMALVGEGNGISVSAGKLYDISLKAIANAEGVKLKGGFFYDKDGKFLGSVEIDNTTRTTLTAPADAAYMKIIMCNIYSSRSESAYKQYLKTGELKLTVKESENISQ